MLVAGFDDYDLNVKQPGRIEPLENREHGAQQERKKKQHQPPPEETVDHFGELSRAAELAHESLIRNRSPYRFCVYKEGKEIFIDLVILDSNGNVVETRKRNITHQEFYKWIEHIDKGEGLFFDSKA